MNRQEMKRYELSFQKHESKMLDLHRERMTEERKLEGLKKVLQIRLQSHPANREIRAV